MCSLPHSIRFTEAGGGNFVCKRQKNFIQISFLVHHVSDVIRMLVKSFVLVEFLVWNSGRHRHSSIHLFVDVWCLLRHSFQQWIRQSVNVDRQASFGIDSIIASHVELSDIFTRNLASNLHTWRAYTNSSSLPTGCSYYFPLPKIGQHKFRLHSQ